MWKYSTRKLKSLICSMHKKYGDSTHIDSSCIFLLCLNWFACIKKVVFEFFLLHETIWLAVDLMRRLPVANRTWTDDCYFTTFFGFSSWKSKSRLSKMSGLSRWLENEEFSLAWRLIFAAYAAWHRHSHSQTDKLVLHRCCLSLLVLWYLTCHTPSNFHNKWIEFPQISILHNWLICPILASLSNSFFSGPLPQHAFLHQFLSHQLSR